MTLLIASQYASGIWMVADTAISDETRPVREREDRIKILPAANGRALVGFASKNADDGFKAIAAAAAIDNPQEAIEHLRVASSYGLTDFTYGYLAATGPALIKMAQGKVDVIPTLHLGNDDAFEHFQRVRHDQSTDVVPNAMSFFVIGASGEQDLPNDIGHAVTAMLRVIAERAEKDVGGSPIPFVLTEHGAVLCTYGYAVSDPIFDKLKYGSNVPHGTADLGGFTLSVTDIENGAGVVVYRLQQPGGSVFLRNASGYAETKFQGRPAEFMATASLATGRKIELWVSDEPDATPEHVTVFRDETGKPSMALAHHKNSFSVSVLNEDSVFKTDASFDLSSIDANLNSKVRTVATSEGQVKITIGDKLNDLVLSLETKAGETAEMRLDAADLDNVISLLGRARASLNPAVSDEPLFEQGGQEVLITDPAWRTRVSPHGSIKGLILRLRHRAFGWVSFLLPPAECESLGDWLKNHANDNI